MEMNEDWLKRERQMLGDVTVDRLSGSHVLVVGLGGVGAYAAELVCRAGVGEMTIVDGDKVEESNKNRQLLALESTRGKSKAGLMAARLKDINPDLKLHVFDEYIRDERIAEILSLYRYDYVVDAIDTVSPKLYLIYNCVKMGIRIVSSMGSGGKLDPGKVQTADIADTYACPLARVIRKRLHRLGIDEGVKVIFSSENTPKNAVRNAEEPHKKSTVGTVSYIPPIFGCFLAAAVITDITKTANQ